MTFEAALANRDREALIAYPKSELHTHATLGGSRSFVRERTGIDIVPLDRVLSSMDEMHEWVSANRIGEAFPGAAGRILALEATFVQAKDDGVTRLEAGEDVWALTLWNGDALALVGEWGTADDVWQAVEELGLDEVQHGIAAAESPAVMRFLADHQIRLNMCPTSNVMLGRVDSIANHPIRTLYHAGVPVTVNTDDVLVFGSSVSEEYIRLYETGVFSTAELNQIRLNGLTDPVVVR